MKCISEMNFNKPRPSHVAWGVLGAGVLAYEVTCPQGETLSEGLDDLLEKSTTKAAIMAAVGVTALHLVNILPQKIDPYHQLTRYKR